MSKYKQHKTKQINLTWARRHPYQKYIRKYTQNSTVSSVHTTSCHYNTVHYSMILHTALQWLRRNRNQDLNWVIELCEVCCERFENWTLYIYNDIAVYLVLSNKSGNVNVLSLMPKLSQVTLLDTIHTKGILLLMILVWRFIYMIFPE